MQAIDMFPLWHLPAFWSSVDLTGNQTDEASSEYRDRMSVKAVLAHEYYGQPRSPTAALILALG